MKEKTFSKKELLEIESTALDTTNPIGGVVFDGNSTEKSILTISKVSGLIFVEGNGETGFEHIRLRHGFFSIINFWRSNEEGVNKLDNPSRFNPRMMPIIDFVKVADSIFKSENKNVTKNSRPDDFDKYTGVYLDGEKYHLIVYKNTKIVHTLFPQTKKQNIKHKIKYGRGEVSSSLKLPEGVNDLLIPYMNDTKQIVYSILLRKIYAEQVEILIIQKHDKEGNPSHQFTLGQRKFKEFEKFSRQDLEYFQFANLTEYEKFIIQLEEELDKTDN